MVLLHDMKEVLGSTCMTSAITLPTFKENKLEISYKETAGVLTEYNGKEPLLPFASTEVFNSGISAWRRLTALDEDCKAVYEVTFDVANSNFTFKAGDTIGIVPRNNHWEVEEILCHLNLSKHADWEYTLGVSSGQKGGKLPPHIPFKSTLRHVLTYCCDIRSILKKLFILTLSKHTTDDNERKILEYICSKEGSTTYNTHILNKQFCILDLFSIFKSCKPPIEVLLANLPRLLPRPYSIVNSGLVDNTIIKICFSVIELENNRKGLVTEWLESVIINHQNNDIETKMESLNINNDDVSSKIPIYLRKNMSAFSQLDNLEIPMILIGPGTGVSPFIGFLEERQYLTEKSSEQKLGDVCLFFGCRNPQLDFLYENELNSYLDKGVLSNLITAFSRIENSNWKYIQDALLHNGSKVVNLIQEGAAIFVCGDVTKMATQVRDTIVSCLIKHGGKSQPEAEQLLSDLQTGRRYLVDAWS